MENDYGFCNGFAGSGQAAQYTLPDLSPVAVAGHNRGTWANWRDGGHCTYQQKDVQGIVYIGSVESLMMRLDM